MDTQTILVTGAAGFLGSNLIDFLLDKGYRVIGADTFQTGSPKNLQHLENHPRFTLINHNVQAPFDNLDQIDQIYNLACPASPIQYQKDPLSTLKTCFLGAENVLNLAKSRNIRLLHTSTSEVYGDPLVHPQPETYWGNVNPFGPRSCYDEGKRAAEALCYAYRQQYQTDIRIARIFNAYGPRLRADDGRVISSFIACALRGDDIQITGDGTATRSFQYVTDCVRGLYTLMNSEYAEPVNIGNDAEISMQELAERTAEMVAKVSGRKKVGVVYRPVPVDDVKVRRPDITLAREKLGWEPVVLLEDGLKESIEWYMENS
ncbi:hypothetical protein ASPWEDRAFT_180998 [Aspergillus wentii DTO 134E9]|uniref:UDP-glucuronic acid decarboxylase 1 n=1 Tax=Aspergillus wentii DTO 134E9 TaxID=1073089 RepID=A0A1L9RXK6_ASPWE|nr:uncharacterized protein ASPWEDRAFT_180998 [Aspergillus wentii DTO 134E9]KAI9931708.1 UDP-glucuronic acid decarboxylase 1 [Aspergillus wentii]OJJ39614.1 hypothetical protein ASPWEDRAFT_180998 [Aspergillus wentii DTO 134E9]